MSIRRMREIKHLRQILSATSWTSYTSFMETVVKSNAMPESAHLILSSIKAQDIDRALELADELVEQMYPTAATHYAAHQLAALIRKYPFPDGSHSCDPEGKALETFERSEQHCRALNLKFRSGLVRPDMNQALETARQYIEHVLGSSPPLAEVYSSSGFGPGANIGVHGNATNLSRKLNSEWSVSPAALHYSTSAAAQDLRIWELVMSPESEGPFCYDIEDFRKKFFKRVKLVDYNKIAFVPKTVRTHRSIAVEPMWNSYIQKGIDVAMRKRLARVGIDLSDQSSNSEWARLGSLEGDDPFVTIDLSAASDSISIEVCRLLLPSQWFDLLNSTRSQNYRIADSTQRYEKFCSMGNGFCFPLETLLFAAFCRAAGSLNAGQDFLVYGDDIVVRQSVSNNLLRILNYFGFAVNLGKTFLEGPFRESCGRDWFGGEDVRPFILDFRIDSLEALFKILNLSRRSDRTSLFFRESFHLIEEKIPKALRFVRPCEGNADSGYHVEKDKFMSSPYAKWSRDLQCWSWYELRTQAVRDVQPASGRQNVVLMFAALSGVSSRDPFTVRRKSSTRVRRVAYSEAKSTWLPAPSRMF